MQDQHADLEWRSSGSLGDAPVSTRFDDPYFSRENGLAETAHVFLAGNDLPARFRDGFHVAELGFGSGLNLLATLNAWREARTPGVLRYTSFEAFPMRADDMVRALAAFPQLAALTAELAPHWRAGEAVFALPDLHFTMVRGDARETVAEWPGRADAWYLDGFSPAKNPEMWEASLLRAVGARTASGGTAATYTAAGFVRRGLAAAGFDVTRTPGFGRKRHMTRARLA